MAEIPQISQVVPRPRLGRQMQRRVPCAPIRGQRRLAQGRGFQDGAHLRTVAKLTFLGGKHGGNYCVDWGSNYHEIDSNIGI